MHWCVSWSCFLLCSPEPCPLLVILQCHWIACLWSPQGLSPRSVLCMWDLPHPCLVCPHSMPSEWSCWHSQIQLSIGWWFSNLFCQPWFLWSSISIFLPCCCYTPISNFVGSNLKSVQLNSVVWGLISSPSSVLRRYWNCYPCHALRWKS